MKHNLYIYFYLLPSSFLYSQVGINTENPQQVFHLDGKSTLSTINPKQGIPSKKQQEDDFVITTDGNVGIGTISPSKKLEVNGITKINTLPVNGNINFNATKTLVADDNGVIGAVNGLFLLSYDQYNITDVQGYESANSTPKTYSYKQITGDCNAANNICYVPSSTVFTPLYMVKFDKKTAAGRKFIFMSIDYSIRTETINNIVLAQGFWVNYDIEVLINDNLVKKISLIYNLPAGGPTSVNTSKVLMINLDKVQLNDSNTLKIRLKPTSSLLKSNLGTNDGSFNVNNEMFMTLALNDASFLFYEK